MQRPITMKKDGIQTRNRKLAQKGKKKRGSVVDFFSPFLNAASDRLAFPASAYGNLSTSSNSNYGDISTPGNVQGGSYSRYGDLSNTAAMTQYYNGMAGQVTSQFMAAASQQISASSQNNTSINSNGTQNLYPSVVIPGSVGGSVLESSTVNEHLSSSLSSTLGSSAAMLGNTVSSSSAAAAAAAAASFAAFGQSSVPMPTATGVGAALT